MLMAGGVHCNLGIAPWSWVKPCQRSKAKRFYRVCCNSRQSTE